MVSSSTSFARVRVRAHDVALAERVSAEAFAAGAVGLEEREVTVDGEGVIELLVYAPGDAIAQVRAALLTAGIAVGEREQVQSKDWSEAWREHLDAIPISHRLVVRPSFVPFALAEGQQEIVIDPGQAFGTGNHESTRLALAWVSALAPGLPDTARVLDVGIGTGVLALSALRLSEARALGFDLDPLAPEAARANARANRLSERLQCFTGGIESLAAHAQFELVIANLLRSEVVPILDAIAAHVAPGGVAVLSGLLESEHAEVAEKARRAGLQESAMRPTRRCVDESGVAWISLCLTRSA